MGHVIMLDLKLMLLNLEKNSIDKLISKVRIGEAGEEIGHVDTGQWRGEGESGKTWETGIDLYALPCIK